jgi:hypothetical protein
MNWTIKINETDSELAKRLLWYLKSLAQTKEYDFLKIEEGAEELTEEMKNALDQRYEHFTLHHQDYPDWEDVKQKYSAK